jgi:hypothetical protein
VGYIAHRQKRLHYRENLFYCQSTPNLNQRRLITFALIIAAHWILLQCFSASRRTIQIPEVVVPMQLAQIAPLTRFKALHPKTPSHRIPVTSNPAGINEFSSASEEPGPTIAEVVRSDQAIIAAPALVEPDLPPVPVIKPVATVSTLPPPSASYLLDVMRTEPKVANPYYGSGQILWSHDDKSYSMQLEVDVDFLFAKIRLYSVDSEGTIGDSGVRPVKMTESRRGRSATATHFNYDAGTISFSASTTTIPMQEGAQDRATVLMQLASIGNADPQQFQDGRQLSIQVAEDKDAAQFQFIVLKQETIDTRLGHIHTWHIVRPPRPGVYSSRLDIWVAPELNWLPVQIRNTEVNGAVTTQTIRKIVSGINNGTNQ